MEHAPFWTFMYGREFYEKVFAADRLDSSRISLGLLYLCIMTKMESTHPARSDVIRNTANSPKGMAIKRGRKLRTIMISCPISEMHIVWITSSGV